MGQFENRITALFKIKYPIIQAGMVWTSGWKLASAVSNAGGLGLIGSGSMYPEVLRHHIKNCRQATHQPFGVNIPLIYPDVEKHIEIVIEEQVPIVFTSAGNPAKYTARLKKHNIIVVHVVSSAAFAIKAQSAGCHAVVAEGFEAGGHNGREETTTFVLVPTVRKELAIPLIAAGGIANGRQMLAAMVLGAEGVQIGSRFVCSQEASCHALFKDAVANAGEGATMLAMKQLVPVRLLYNSFYTQVRDAEENGASKEELRALLGSGRAKRGMFLGELEEGELEIGQVCSLIDTIQPAAEIVAEIWRDFNIILQRPLHWQNT